MIKVTAARRLLRAGPLRAGTPSFRALAGNRIEVENGT